jgi:hypothetical protein
LTVLAKKKIDLCDKSIGTGLRPACDPKETKRIFRKDHAIFIPGSAEIVKPYFLPASFTAAFLNKKDSRKTKDKSSIIVAPEARSRI